MIHADGKESVAGVPWRDAGEKETTHALVRALMRRRCRRLLVERHLTRRLEAERTLTHSAK